MAFPSTTLAFEGVTGQTVNADITTTDLLNNKVGVLSADGSHLLNVVVTDPAPWVWDLSQSNPTPIELPNGYSWVYLTGMNEDGSAVFGTLYGNGDYAAARLVDGQWYVLDNQSGYDTLVHGVARYDESQGAIAQAAGNFNFGDVVYWDFSDNAHLLTDADNSWTSASFYALSGNGKVVVGLGYQGSDSGSFRWDLANNTVDLIEAADGLDSFTPIAISLDGSAIAGTGATPGFDPHAALWREGTLVDLHGDISGVISGAVESRSTLISADGQVVVGQAGPDDMNTASVFRWTEQGVIDITAERSGTFSGEPGAISDDGNVVVGGILEGTTDWEAFIWTLEDGFRTVSDALADDNVGTDGFIFTKATSVSADGEVVAGAGTFDGEDVIWVAHCGETCAVTTGTDQLQALDSLGLMGEQTNLYLDGTFATPSGAASGAGPTGSTYAFGGFDTDPSASGGLGITFRLDKDLVLGATVARAAIDTPLAYDGDAAFDATSVTAYLANRPASGFVAEGGVTAAWLDGTVTRGYLNGSDVVSSQGDTTATGWAATAKLGWRFAEVLPGLSVTPYAGFSYASTSYDGWQETGGPFDATIDSFTTTTRMFRLGTDLEQVLADDVTLNAGLAVVHRDTDGGSIAGSIPSVLSAEVGGATEATNWIEASLGARVPLGDAISIGADLVGRLPFDGDASVAGRATLTYSF